jgi:hypothetical protein
VKVVVEFPPEFGFVLPGDVARVVLVDGLESL